MATLNLQITSSASDAHGGSITDDSGRAVTTGAQILPAAGVNSANDLTDVVLSPGSHAGNAEASAGMRFTNVTLAQGTVITSALLTLTAHASYPSPGTISYLVSAEASDNAPVLSNSASAGGSLRSSGAVAPNVNRPRTTAVSAAWNQNTVVIDTEYSIDVTTVVQEILNRAGWVNGNALLIIVDTNTTTTSGEWQDYYSFDGSAIKAPKLAIVYSAAAYDAGGALGGSFPLRRRYRPAPWRPGIAR